MPENSVYVCLLYIFLFTYDLKLSCLQSRQVAKELSMTLDFSQLSVTGADKDNNFPFQATVIKLTSQTLAWPKNGTFMSLINEIFVLNGIVKHNGKLQY